MTTRELLDIFKDYISYNTLKDSELDAELTAADNLPSFTAWSVRWVYFPLANGSIGRVPRSPCDYDTPALGGES